MAAETFAFTMPSLGADMDEGKLVEWLVKAGDTVSKGDIVAVVETAKAVIEVECFRSGVVERILVEAGTTVPVGEPLATLSVRDEAQPERPVEASEVPVGAPQVPVGEQAPAPPARIPPTGPLVRRLAADLGVELASVRGTGRSGAITRADVRRTAREQQGPAVAPAPSPPAAPPPVAPPAPAAPVPAGVRVSPFARRLAGQLGVDLATVRGTGRGGAVRAEDIRAAAAAAEVAPPARAARPVPADEMARRAEAMRQTTARLMARSKREIPHYYVSTAVDVTDALVVLRERNRELPVSERILPAALFLRATVLALAKVPELNGYWEDDHFVPGEAVNLGVAVGVRGGGLVTPSLGDVGDLGLADLGARLRDVATRAKAGRLRGSEMTGATITVTNLGELGVEVVYGVIYPPQVALVGVGRIVERPWAVGGLLGVRSVATLTLSADHRATDGQAGARFLDALSRSLRQPESL